MRRQYLFWTIAVFGIVGTAYGGYLLIYHFNHGKGLFIPALLLLIFGVIALVLFFVAYISYLLAQKKKKEELPPIEEKMVEEENKEPVTQEKPVPHTNSEPKQVQEEYTPRPKTTYESPSTYYASTVYVKQIGCGPVLRIEGNRILDMRNNTYYRIEDNMVMQDGYGPAYEIRGNQIKDAFGGYLFELSGSNINKIFEGFYASINGNYITLYDSSIKYEMTDSLSKRKILVVAALLLK